MLLHCFSDDHNPNEPFMENDPSCSERRKESFRTRRRSSPDNQSLFPSAHMHMHVPPSLHAGWHGPSLDPVFDLEAVPTKPISHPRTQSEFLTTSITQSKSPFQILFAYRDSVLQTTYLSMHDKKPTIRISPGHQRQQVEDRSAKSPLHALSRSDAVEAALQYYQMQVTVLQEYLKRQQAQDQQMGQALNQESKSRNGRVVRNSKL